MTLEEAIKLLKQYQGYEPMFPDGETLKHAFDLTDETVDTLLSALRPVSREQIELHVKHLWPGCPRCSMPEDEALDAGGSHEFRVLGDSLYYCDSEYGWEGEKIGYCPWCGKPLGKATGLKHIEKLEVLLND